MKMRIAIPTTGKRKLSNKVADTFSRAPTFTIVTFEEDAIRAVEVIGNPGETPERGAGPLAAKLLKDNDINVLITGEMGPGARNILDALEIEIHMTQPGKKVEDVVLEFANSSR